jgi:ABC-type antimicrobial peptide transport system permease subunit
VQKVLQGGSNFPEYARVRAYQDLLDPQLRSWRLGAALFSTFSLLALGIATVGVSGVISYTVSSRTRELGVRIAIGATRQRAWQLLLRNALRLVGEGIVVGAFGGLAAGISVRDLLFQTWEASNLLLSAMILMIVTIAAAIWPAWRASRVRPLVALKIEEAYYRGEPQRRIYLEDCVRHRLAFCCSGRTRRRAG